MNNIFKINTPVGPLHLLVGADGSRWLAAAPLVDLLGLSLRRDIMQRGDANPRFWRIGTVEGRTCIPAERCTELLKAIKDEHVRKDVRPALQWLRAHAYQTLTGFQVPASAPRLPMDDSEPARAQPVLPVKRIQRDLQPAALGPGPAVPDDQLVTLRGTEPVTTTLAIAQGTEVEHKNVMDLVRTYANDLKEFGTFAFETRKSGGRPTEFALLNEPQATLLLTYMRNSEIVRGFKKRLVRAFYDLARAHTAPAQVNLSRMDLITMALESEQARIVLAGQVEELAPKAEFHDRVAISTNGITIGEMAKLLGLGQNRLFAQLKADQILMDHGRQENLPYQQYLNTGYFMVKEGTYDSTATKEPHTYRQTLVTGKGQPWLQKRYARPVQG